MKLFGFDGSKAQNELNLKARRRMTLSKLGEFGASKGLKA